MSVFSVLGNLVKGKVLVTTLVGAAFVGSAGVALAATPTGQQVVQTLTGTHATPTHQSDDADKNTNGHAASPTTTTCKMDDDGASNQTDDDKNTHGEKVTPTATPCEENEEGNSNPCPDQPDTQRLATKYSLSTDSKSNSMQVICTLHDGTFKGTVDGKSVTTNHNLGYGEIDQLLTYAQSLAKKDNTTLTDSNVLMYVATALKNCGSTAIEVCVNTNVPDNPSSGSDNSNGHDSAKPTVTPSHEDGKPTGTPTPHSN